MSEDHIAPNAQPFRGLGFRASVAIMGIYSNYYGFSNLVTYGQNLRKSQSCMCRLYANIEISWHAVEVNSYGFGVVLELLFFVLGFGVEGFWVASDRRTFRGLGVRL